MVFIRIVRHGQTDFNLKHKIQGDSDIPLNENGRNQAELCKENFLDSNIKFDKVYSSPLSRTLETAKIITGLSYDEIEKLDDLAEYKMGKWEGVDSAVLKSSLGVDKVNEWEHKIETAEPFENFEKRVINVYNKIVQESNDFSNVLIVAHQGVIRVLISYLKKIDYEEIERTYNINNCYVFEINGAVAGD